ncbi:MAG: PIN domain-containing protein [Candidatus Micrarchaeota archaeon]|nr:PIN domain-containing protein [Candidatus Micrarchaeota archaeon]
MILDTTYILPLAKIGIDTDLLTLIDEGKIRISMDDVRVSMISLFELQARVAKYKLPPKLAVDAVNIINSSLKIEPFYNPEVIEVADKLSRELSDYVDCLILATAIALKEDLVTEDSEINKKKAMIEGIYKIRVLRYRDVIKQ